MKAKEVLKMLQISRPTLSKYVKEGWIRTETLPNGHYEYNDDDVYKFMMGGVERKTYLYARVSTSKQKKDLENQIELLKQFCFSNGYKIHGVYSEEPKNIKNAEIFFMDVFWDLETEALLSLGFQNGEGWVWYETAPVRLKQGNNYSVPLNAIVVEDMQEIKVLNVKLYIPAENTAGSVYFDNLRVFEKMDYEIVD